jgi:hypothetical protein
LRAFSWALLKDPAVSGDVIFNKKQMLLINCMRLSQQ